MKVWRSLHVCAKCEATYQTREPLSMIMDIWRSFRRLPVWVQLWVGLILVPVNVATVMFLSAPYGTLIAVLSLAGMVPNLLILMRERGFSKTMALPHLAFWPFLVLAIVWALVTAPMSDAARTFFIAVLVIDVISLAFDIPDAMKWLKGDRDIA